MSVSRIYMRKRVYVCAQARVRVGACGCARTACVCVRHGVCTYACASARVRVFECVCGMHACFRMSNIKENTIHRHILHKGQLSKFFRNSATETIF